MINPKQIAFRIQKHWRARAEEVRVKANAMASPELKERMLLIATDYDHLAERFERDQGNQ